MKQLTRYEKELARLVGQKYGDLPTGELVENLCRLGVIDYSMCKVLAVRTHVDELMRTGGYGKVDAMWMASERFCSTYEYIRKCMYYYTDVGF